MSVELTPGRKDRTIKRLVSNVQADASLLVLREIALAKAQLQEKVHPSATAAAPGVGCPRPDRNAGDAASARDGRVSAAGRRVVLRPQKDPPPLASCSRAVILQPPYVDLPPSPDPHAMDRGRHGGRCGAWHC